MEGLELDFLPFTKQSNHGEGDRDDRSPFLVFQDDVLVHPIAHGPGPPQRPHIGPSDDGDDLPPPSDDTAANTLSARVVCVEPQSGQGAFSVELIERTSFSNRFPHGRHSYS